MSSTWRAVMAGPPLGALVASIPNTGSRFILSPYHFQLLILTHLPLRFLAKRVESNLHWRSQGRQYGDGIRWRYVGA